MEYSLRKGLLSAAKCRGLIEAPTSPTSAAFRQALEILRGVDPARFSGEDEARILAAIEAEIGNEAMRRALEGPVVTLPEAIYQAEAMAAARQAAGIDYAFGVKDEAALDLVRRFDLHWIGRHWDAGTRAAVTGAVAEFFENGWTYETLADRLREAFDGIEERGMAYWQLTADTIATKTRELGRVAGYEQAGVRYLEVRAHIDERTTPICRSLHGRLIRLETVTRQRDRYLEAIGRGHMEAAKAAWPMFDASMAFSGGTKVLPENVGLPPYHFRCRTVTVAYLGEDPERFALDFGAGVSDAARAAIGTFSAAEHLRRAETFRRQAAAERLAWDEAHLRQDLRKQAMAILRHARRAVVGHAHRRRRGRGGLPGGGPRRHRPAAEVVSRDQGSGIRGLGWRGARRSMACLRSSRPSWSACWPTAATAAMRRCRLGSPNRATPSARAPCTATTSGCRR